MPVDVAIVGGGISGLTAARTLCARGLDVRLVEREPVCGGVIRTDVVDGFIIDTGPDTLLAHKPAALALVRELGLEDRLVAPLPRRTTHVVRDSRLRTLPETSALGYCGHRTETYGESRTLHQRRRLPRRWIARLHRRRAEDGRAGLSVSSQPRERAAVRPGECADAYAG
jgi:protoporphyrinogen oxidase